MGNIVAIVGRPNVGKSTLFNRLTGTRQAIVNEEAGTTRDRQYGKVEWTGKEFSLIDTGGWVVNSEDVFEEEINKQVKVAIEEADVILFVVDVLNGITDMIRNCNTDMSSVCRIFILLRKIRGKALKMRFRLRSRYVILPDLSVAGCGRTKQAIVLFQMRSCRA